MDQIGKSDLMYLQEALKKIEDPLCWAKGHVATDREGIPVALGARKAVKFSLAGSLLAIKPTERDPEWDQAWSCLQHVTGGDPQRWNDRWWRSHKGVLKALRRAIELNTSKDWTARPHPAD